MRKHLIRPIADSTWQLVAALLLTVSGVLILTMQPAGAQEKPTLAITEVDANTSVVSITNHGDTDVDPNGIILCNFPAYAPIAGADVIGPGETITVDSGAAGVLLDAGGGEFGLYTGNDFTDASLMVSYVEWGTAGHQRSPVAVAADVWDGEFVDAGTGVLSASVDNPTSAADWAGAAANLAVTGASTWLVTGLAIGLIALGAGITSVSVISRRRLIPTE
jgi:hypothetical protein